MPKRRGNHEGSIVKLKDGRWQGRVSLPNGRRKSVYGKTQNQCRQKLNALKRQLEDNLYVDTDLTVEQYLEKWLEHRALEVRPKTLAGDSHVCRKRLIPKLGKVKLSQLSVMRVQTMLTEVAREVSPSNANRARKVLRNALGQAVRWQIIARNPVEATRKLKEEQNPMTLWSYEEAARFRAAARDHHLYPLFLLAMSTGMRLSEVLGLRWKDILGNRIHICHTATEVNGELHFAETTKTDHSNRTITISPDVVEALEAHRREQQARYDQLGFVPEHGLVFDSLVGTPLLPRNLERTFAILKARAGVPKISFHDLRHWHASMLIEEGIDIRLIAKRLGHAGPHITLRIYVHLFDRDQQVEAPSLDDVLAEFEEAEPRYLN